MKQNVRKQVQIKLKNVKNCEQHYLVWLMQHTFAGPNIQQLIVETLTKRKMLNGVEKRCLLLVKHIKKKKKKKKKKNFKLKNVTNFG